ncbi:DUF1853 family protein [Undibacterium sp. SXout7W]|uniref:DUF1853 family protein n=1 Tax=Undibacterium sp. SXout7W TaxID=3413049 RepID=UPI003BF1C4D2
MGGLVYGDGISARPSHLITAFQSEFHRQWQQLADPHVRSLAWLLTSPDLLEHLSPVWLGASLNPPLPFISGVVDWLLSLDSSPQQLQQLHLMLARKKHRRLGLYAETLLEFYFAEHGILYARGLQVRDAQGRTVGEFDFLVRQGDALAHWELATKFYLFCPANTSGSSTTHGFNVGFDAYVGPNLQDNLALKMHKMLHQQLRLASHPLAVSALPEPVISAQAFIKGWLFYGSSGVAGSDSMPGMGCVKGAEETEDTEAPSILLEGIAPQHARGYIWTLAEFCHVAVTAFDAGVILDRLDWLAPAQCDVAAVRSISQLSDAVATHFSLSATPLLVAGMRVNEGCAQELCRGMLVPDDWWQRAINR